MRVSSLALLAAASTLCAQTTPQTSAALSSLTTQVLAVSAAGAGCPIGFTARRSPSGGLVQTRKGALRHNLGYELNFVPGTSQPRAITQARVTFHGLAGAQVLPASGSGEGSATEEFLLPGTGSGFQFHFVVYAHKLTGVQFVELNELTYADGTQWHESADNPCRIAPNGFMPVSLSGY